MQTIRKLTKEDVKWSITPHQEHAPVRGNAISSGDDKADRRIEDRIIRDMQTREWAWCCVEVRGTYRGLSFSDYLGCCNYRNEKDFVENSGYYEQMVDNVLTTLNDAVESILAGVTTNEE